MTVSSLPPVTECLLSTGSQFFKKLLEALQKNEKEKKKRKAHYFWKFTVVISVMI